MVHLRKSEDKPNKAMKLLILKTDINSLQEVKQVQGLFENMQYVKDWNIDREDIDNVLRMEVTEYLSEQKIIALLSAHGFYCEELPD